MRFLNKHSALEKELRRLEREDRRLGHARFHAPLVPLARAFQRGWVKTFVLADGVARRPDAHVFRTILAAVNRSVWARERSFVHHRTRELIELHPRVIPLREWEAFSWPVSHRRLFELGVWRVSPHEALSQLRWQRCVHGYKLVRTWWLREDVQPHLVTHQQVDLPDVKSRLAEIDAFMAHHCGRERLNRLHGRRRWHTPGAAAERHAVDLAEHLARPPDET